MAKGPERQLLIPLTDAQTIRIMQKLAVLLLIDDISLTYPHIHSPNNDTR